MRPADVQIVRQAALLLGWGGEHLTPVNFLGVSCWAVASLNAAEHERRCATGIGPVVDRERLESQLTAGRRRTIAPPLQLVGGLVEGGNADGAVRDAALLAGYAPRAVLLVDQPSLLGPLTDAAVLDVGVVVKTSTGPQLLSPAGPRVPGGTFDAREWLLLETLYAAILLGSRAETAA